MLSHNLSRAVENLRNNPPIFHPTTTVNYTSNPGNIQNKIENVDQLMVNEQ